MLCPRSWHYAGLAILDMQEVTGSSPVSPTTPANPAETAAKPASLAMPRLVRLERLQDHVQNDQAEQNPVGGDHQTDAAATLGHLDGDVL
jgi:hypothetical protein